MVFFLQICVQYCIDVVVVEINSIQFSPTADRVKVIDAWDEVYEGHATGDNGVLSLHREGRAALLELTKGTGILLMKLAVCSQMDYVKKICELTVCDVAQTSTFKVYTLHTCHSCGEVPHVVLFPAFPHFYENIPHFCLCFEKVNSLKIAISINAAKTFCAQKLFDNTHGAP